jgi:ribose transport system permease protein
MNPAVDSVHPAEPNRLTGLVPATAEVLMSADAAERDAPATSTPARAAHASSDEPPASTAVAVRRRRDLPSLGLAALRVGPALMLFVVMVAAAVLSPVFFTTRNVGNVLSQTAVIAILALAQLLVIVTRGIDLSVGSTLALSAVVGAVVFESVRSGPFVILVMLATGMAVGAVNGVVYVWGRLPHPFIMTLAMLSIARGLALWLAGGQPISGMPEVVQQIGGEGIGWLPYSAFLVAGLALLTLLLTRAMVWGRWIFAVGGNPDAARRAAVPVERVLISVYVLSGLAAGIAGVVNAGRLDGGSPTFGELAELDAIAAVVIGGASFHGGRGHVGNALVGALMIGVIRNAMNLLDVNAFLQPIVIGAVIVLAVELDVVRARLEERLRVIQAAQS